MSLHEQGASSPASPQKTPAPQPESRTSYPETATGVDQALDQIRRWERTSRVIASDSALSLKGKCRALLDLMARARRSELAAFLEIAVGRGCSFLFVEEQEVPRDIIAALRRLRHRGLDRCPECRRDLPSHDELDRWVQLRHTGCRRTA
jgi:hypothetical protein